MEFEKIIAVSGKPGLFQIISQSKNAVIAESLLDNKRVAINASSNISLLDNIAIYSYEGDVKLATIFKTMFEKEGGKETISHKSSNQEVLSYFLEVLPDFDEDRVYASNIKKVIQWYNLLVKSGMDLSQIKDEEQEA
ncbi:MAG: DUF5606 domain-containing protein [Polaribacter sp.]|jgi:hypothetical protein